MSDFKPINIQFPVDDPELAKELREIAEILGNERGDRRIGYSAAAKELVERLLRNYPELVIKLFSGETVSLASEERETYESPKARRKR